MRPPPRTLSSLVVAAAVSSACPAEALADDGTRLRESAHAWFDGERNSGFLWGGAGLLSLGAATALHRFGNGSDIERGMAYPMFAIGGLQTLIGIGALLRGRGRENDLDTRIAASPEEARKSEVARMKTLQAAFLAIEIVEALIVVGGATFAATRGEGHELARGVGLGLAIEGGSMMLLDSFAASRAHTYAGQLDALAPTPSAPSAAFVSYGGLFLAHAISAARSPAARKAHSAPCASAPPVLPRCSMRYLKGDATSPVGDGPRIIVHVCNDVGGWGAGFVLAISRRWPQPEASYRAWHRDRQSNGFALGQVQLVQVEPHLWVANLVGQHGLRRASGKPPVRYDAIAEGLVTVRSHAQHLCASVHMPRIGCGLAGGSWQEIEPLLRDNLTAHGIDVTVYDLP